MEDFRGIAEESFPSFLTNSLLGNSGILENVTLSSNLGLPVAVSTLARNRPSTDNRYPDVQASYLIERGYSVPTESSPSCQSDIELRERLHLSFPDEDSISRKKNYMKSEHLSSGLMKQLAFQSDTTRAAEDQPKATKYFQSQDPFDSVSSLEQVQADSSVDFCLQPWMNNKENKVVVPGAGKHCEHKIPNTDLSHTSFLENERLTSLTSLEDSSVDDDINDEEFYDDHLEAYFEQLAIPGMIYEDLEGQEPPEKSFKLPTSDPCQENENSGLTCKFQSESNSFLVSHGSHSSENSETTHKESEEGHAVCHSGIKSGNSRTHGDGSSQFPSSTWRTEKKRTESLKGVVPDQSRESTREGVLMKTLVATKEKLNPVHSHDASADDNSSSDLNDPVNQGAGAPQQSKHLVLDSETTLRVDGCLDSGTPAASAQKPVDVVSLKPASNDGINSNAILWSPTCERRTCAFYDFIGKNKDQTHLSQSVIYQNEDGKWVTDLAYYTSFNNEQNFNMSLNEKMNEDFKSGSEALDLIAQDEEEFNKEHQFIQEENIDARNTSVALGDTSWLATVNYNLLRKSFSTSDLNRDDASYLRLSLGEFFAQRSEALGCLDGGNNVKRPSFGYFIRSPEKTEPIALIRKSDLSRSNMEKEMTHLNRDPFSGDLNEQSEAQLSEGSVTLQVEALESTSQVDENDVTLTASKSKTEDTFFRNNKLQTSDEMSTSGSDSVLRISTIASAIADASVSTDPSQLVAMIKALTNKNRDKALQEDDKREICSSVSDFSPNDLEKTNASNAFDMEKYLTKTEVNRQAGRLENLSRAGMSGIWDLSLPKEQSIQEMNLGTTNVSGREPRENTAAIFYGENGDSGNQKSPGAVNSSNSVLTNVRENVDVKIHTIDKVSDVGNSEKATSASTPTSHSSVRNPRITSVWLLEGHEETEDNGECCRQSEYVSETSNSEKHVTFGKHSVVSLKAVDLKNASPERGAHGSEEDQESFRPSTSPLSHSSPSEVSGTSLSGYALESFCSTAQQKPPCESEQSRLASSLASVSRLTYVSEPESTCPTTAMEYGSEDRKSDIISELSTTVMQASPASSEEQAMEKLKEKVPFQNRGQGALSYIIQGSSDMERVTEPTSMRSNSEDVETNFRSSEDPSSKSEEILESSEVGLTSNFSELDPIHLALLSKSDLSHQARSATAHLPVSCRESESASGGQRITSEDMSTGSSECSGHINCSTSGNQHIPVPGILVHGSVAEMQNMPAVLPTLLPRPSLSTAPFAQQYLGTLPVAGNVAVPQCYASSTSVCGFTGYYPYPAVTGEHVQNSVALGICLGPNNSSGLMGPSSLGNPYSNAIHQNPLNTAKPFPAQTAAANCGTEPWDSGITSGFGNVRVPEELKFPHACCVGIASQTHLSLLNPTDRWLQVSIGVLSVSVNGEKVDLSTYPCLVFKNKVIIRPHATEEIKVLFIPSSPGIFRCLFSISSWPFSADAETIVQAEALASRVVLTALAEVPVIDVETEKKDVLDFGDLTYGGWKALPLKLINRTHASVPIRLMINADAVAWRCFMFSKEPIHASVKAAPRADVVSQLAAPSVVSHLIPASYDGQDPEFLIIWVLFHSPKKLIASSEILDSAEEFLARIDIEVDSPNPTPVLRSVALRARAGVARIHAPRDLQTMHLLSSVNSSTHHHLPLKNAGNIEVYLDIKVSVPGSHFSVDPENLFLKPGEEHEVKVSFTPKDPKACEERVLTIFVQPFGPQYEVVLKGEVISSESKPLSPGSCFSDIPSILSNKQFLTWGGVPLGRTQLQKLALRSSSTSTTQHFRLLIRGQDQDCFQLQNTFGSEERLTSNCEIRIRPKEDIIVSVLFAPTRLSCMLAKLEIKQLGSQSQPGIKFMIPLSGYGGTSNLILEGVKKLSDSYMVTVNGLIPGKESKVVFSVRNTGSRAAFVKAVGFKDSQKKVVLDPKVLRIIPDKFVLKERTQEDVTLIYNPSDRKSDHKTATELSTIYFFGGDEISRQQYRRALLHKPGIIKQILPEHSVLQSINFAEAFQDELLVTEVYDLPQRPNDIQLFYGNMRKIILSVIGEFRESVSSKEFLQPSSKASMESQSESGACGKHGGNVSLDVLPVKGPQGSPFLAQAVPLPQDASASEETWTVQPEHLVLVAPPSCDVATPGRFQIINSSVRLLKFELYWPAHCLTVTPQHGFIAPESKLQILVSPNSSLSTKQSMFPWSGLIYIHCDDGQKKIVKVQIREDLAQEELLPHLTSSTFGILTSASEPSVSHLVKPVTKPPSTKVEIRNKTIAFPITEPGKTSESCLELENHGPTAVKWHLSSFAPPYVKGVDESGDVFRATYTAFRCSPITGTLESCGLQKVSVTFLPRDRGHYAQFWDVECHPHKEPHRKHTLRFQLCGQSIRAENESENACTSTDVLVKIDNAATPRRRAVSEASALIPGRQLDLTHRGIYAPEDMYRFLPTKVGESRTIKVNLRNNSFITHSLKFLSPREPFYIKHSKYSLRARHYIHIPVHFRPKSVGKFEGLLVIQTDEGKSVAIRLIAEALEKN
ncbi:centrosomal protein of 192 kDa isoform X1 [Lepus europaeus]|uniref:centrosomal protein of 192 kDa isoform X1 n=1 Tax=Lepus europaeus TaxID=9983 RepID=UPI002B46BC6E|nr:centrosomal protein of 192 kDa isoform X1 [Lepus europaeus]XP_062057296.1 centrosomal protein of 192 kDa isoform X1 [Lepus europaeus]XP_062057297.1 centrosomal protein of 192 kDa isoform X1 [Lepus europaeus]XP_062057298.1 centrosomal protein of 192 kDa isoform X1 [Lepus europaeus]